MEAYQSAVLVEDDQPRPVSLLKASAPNARFRLNRRTHLRQRRNSFGVVDAGVKSGTEALERWVGDGGIGSGDQS